MPLNWIKPLARVLLVAAAVLAVYFGGRHDGQRLAAAEAEKQMAVMHAAALAVEQDYAAKLADAAAEKQKWYDFAQKQSVDLAAALQQLDAAEAANKKEIPNAIKQDNAGAVPYGGLGDNSLRLYRKSLGYSD
ncbi:phage associated protein [Bergeriella denitrificans]|uniref:Phage associated protein n=2 Tax=Bergeriella denitrificans TaxID=494 RepID=A0A378UFR7_BERDE|nr:phage associated protein [Bergeriella denitrificans]